MNPLVLVLCFFIAAIGLYAIYASSSQPKRKPCISERFDNPTDPLSPNSPSAKGGQLSGKLDDSLTPDSTGAPAPSPSTASTTLPSRVADNAGVVPAANQTSAISNTLPISSVPDPAASIAQNKDIQSTLDAISAYYALLATATPSLFPASTQQIVAETTGAINEATLALNTAQLNPSASTLTVAQLSALRSRIATTTQSVKQLTATQGKPSMPIMEGFEVVLQQEFVPVDTLKTTFTRIAAAIDKLAGKPTPNTARISQLTELKDRLKGYIQQLESNTITVYAVPMTLANQVAFLRDLDDETKPLGTLFTPAAGTVGPTGTVGAGQTGGTGAGGTGGTGAAGPTGLPPPAAPEVITLAQLNGLSTRITAATLVLANLASSDVVTGRINALGLLKANVEEYIAKVRGGFMDIKDVPITPTAATAFLDALDDRTKALPPLIDPAGANNAASSNVDLNSAAILQSLLQSFQTLVASVKFQATYDPATAQNAAVMARMQALEEKLFAYANSSTPLPPAILDAVKQELIVLGYIVKPNSLAPPGPAAGTTQPQPSYASLTQPAEGFSAPYVPSAAALASAAGSQGPVGNQRAGNQGANSQGPYLNPVPFSGLSSAQIATRGSAASFDERTVGGYDYRDRTVEICRQIKAEYGDNKTFGCIEDPRNVSADYSWKGNYLSVCNRLGDVWGSQAGEKYGCPPFNPNRKFRQS